MECDPPPREMDKEQPRGDKHKLLRVFHTILMYTYRECNLCPPDEPGHVRNEAMTIIPVQGPRRMEGKPPLCTKDH